VLEVLHATQMNLQALHIMMLVVFDADKPSLASVACRKDTYERMKRLTA